jgi:hypothetical protein
MREITIIGAGQSGLMVALGLIQKDYKVSLISNRTAEQIRNGRILSSQGMMQPAIQAERDLGLRFWEDQCPYWEGLQFTIVAPDLTRAISFNRPTPGQWESLDQRVKISDWMEKFVEWGGNLIIDDADIDKLEHYTEQSDLVLIASGKGEIGKLFERDAEKSPYDKPMRSLALTYVFGMDKIAPVGEEMKPFHGLTWYSYPEVGEYFTTRTLTTSGICDVMIFEGVLGGPMDCWDDVKTPEQHLKTSMDILHEFFPWEARRCENIKLTDDNGILTGRFPPTVRKPIGTLPSGAIVMGIGDTVCLNDPVTGQGANNAAKCGKVVHDRIVEHESAKFNAQWMQSVFDEYWMQAKHVTKWTNSLLEVPPDGAFIVLSAAEHNTKIADHVFNGFNDAALYEPWFYDVQAAEELVAEMSE